MAAPEPDGAQPSRTLILVWMGLVLLACLSVVAYWTGPSPYGPAVALAVATAKAGLVFYFFMDLRHEGAAFQILFFLAVILVVSILGLTFLDIEYR